MIAAKNLSKIGRPGEDFTGRVYGTMEVLWRAREREAARISAALEQLKGWNADCLGLARRAGQTESARWNALRAQWPEVFPELEIQVTVQASLLAA